MKKLFPFYILSIFLLAGGLFAQQPDAPPAEPKPAEVRANALRQLGLSREQLMEIRKINQTRKPQMEQAQERLRIANRALDAAIYSDAVDEQTFQTRLREFHAAQAEVARIRFVNELAVRRVLNADQVGRFRQIRERFERAREVRKSEMPAKQFLPKMKRALPASNR